MPRAHKTIGAVAQVAAEFMDTAANLSKAVVDFKTSQHEGGDVGAFLDSEVARYAPQLERYARAMAAIDSRHAQLGLYFPLLDELRSWPFAVIASPSS